MEDQVKLDTNSPAVRMAAQRLFYRTSEGVPYFLKNQLKISSAEIGLVSMIPNAVQVPALKAAMRQLKEKGKIRAIWFKCRQPGASTLASALIWNRVSMFDGMYAFIVAQDRGTVEHLFNIHNLFYKTMVSGLCRPKRYHTKGFEMVLGDVGDDEDASNELDSRLLTAEAKNLHLGTGRTLHCLHLSELCRYPTSDPIKESLLPACSDAPGTVRIMESTAHFGQGADYFRYMCEVAMSGKSEYEYHFMEWWRLKKYAIPLERGEKLKLDVAERHYIKEYGMSLENIKWRRKMIQELEGDEDSFKLSYPTNYEEAWITKQTSAFPQDRLMEIHSMLRPPIKRFRIEAGQMYEHPQGEFWVWHMPQLNKVYDIGADVGEGHVDGDPSTAQVLERGSNIQCAEYRGFPIPSDFAIVLAALGRFYNNAQIGPEVNAVGLQTTHELAKIYSNMYIWRKQDAIAPKLTGLLGWKTQYDSKLLMVGLGHKRLYHRQVQIFSERLWQEMRYFGRDYTDTGMITYRAVSGHDDLVMAWLIALKISDDENFEVYRQISDNTGPAKKPPPEKALYDVEGLHPTNTQNLNVDTGAWR